MKILARKFIILLPAVAVWGHVFQSKVVWGQGAAPKVSAGVAADQYAGESIVLERSDAVYSMAADGTGTLLRTVVVRVQSDAAVKELGIIGIAFAGATQRVEFQYARVRRPDGTVVETPVGDAQEVPAEVTRQAPFYSDLKQKQLPIRSLRVGDRLEWQARVVLTKAEAPGQFWGQESLAEDAVILEQSVELRVPKDKTVKVWSPTLKPVESVAGGERVYRWANSLTKPTTGKEAEAEAEAKKKKVWTAEQEVDEKEGKLPTIAWTTFPSWEAVGAWYRGLEGDRMVASAEVKAKVAEVTAGKMTEEEKVRAVYGYVGTQVRYIGVAFGVGRYQPHRAEEVLENQYGDCKDKHTLLAAMLGVLGVKSDAVLVGAGIRFNPDVPSPASFNHLITLATVGGQPVWLDATAEVAPYRMLVAPIRDHSALAIPETGVARVEKTPAELPFKPFQKMDSVGTLDKDGISNSKITWTLRGDDEVTVRAVLRQIAPAQYEQLMQNMSRNMGYGGTTSHAEFGRADDTAEPLVIRYDYHREKAGNDWEHFRTIAQLAPVSLPVLDEKEPPVRATDLGVPRVETSTSAMKLPDGWGAELPEAVHAHSSFANFDETYRFENGTLYAERKVEVLAKTVPVSDWKSYKKFSDAAGLGNEMYIQLTRTGAKKASAAIESAPKDDPDRPRLSRKPAGTTVPVVDRSNAEAAPPPSTEAPVEVHSNAEAAKLVATALGQLQVNDTMEAKENLDKAKALNVSQAELWSAYGYIAFKHGEATEAMKDYEKELTMHPDETPVYGALAATQMAMDRKTEGIATMRRWVAADPSNPQATVLLVNTLLAEDDAAGAVTAAESGVAGLPEDLRKDEGLQLGLGTAQVKAGMKEKAGVTLVALLKSTENTSMMNSAAYELSLTGQQLELAESSVRTALSKMGDESKTWTLDENLTTLKSKSQLIAATWDTLGWILFLEKKPEEAENFLRAAWANHQDAEVGEHIGDLLASRKDRVGAAKMYELALATIPPYTGMGVKRDKTTAQEIKLRDKLKANGGMVAKDSVRQQMDGAKALQEMRTIPLGPADGRSGTAEFKLLIGADGVQRVERVGDKEVAKGEETVMKAKMKAFVPVGSDARLVRAGILNCHSAVCELMLEP